MSATDWIVAVPSYRRPAEIKRKTLATLARQGVPTCKIYVFVATETELEAYTSEVGSASCTFVVGVPGLVNQRKFISDYFEKGQKIISMDDDIESVYSVYSKKDNDNKEIDLFNFFTSAFQVAKAEGVTLWGLYPVDNAYFAYARKKISTTFTYICGAVYGYINTDVPDIETGDALEDRARSILYYEAEGKTLRFNHICYRTKYFAHGGMESDTRQEEHDVVATVLEEAYPHLVQKVYKTNGYADVKFKRQPSHDEPGPYEI